MRTDVIGATVAAWTADPAKAKGSPAVSARAQGAQAEISAGPFTWRADLPAPLGGSNEAPSPTALLLGALAGCAVVFVKDVLGPQLGIAIDSVEASVACDTDARGLLAMDDAEPRLQNLRLEVVISSPDGSAAVSRVEQAWKQRCPIYLALLEPQVIQTSFRAT